LLLLLENSEANISANFNSLVGPCSIEFEIPEIFPKEKLSDKRSCKKASTFNQEKLLKVRIDLESLEYKRMSNFIRMREINS